MASVPGPTLVMAAVFVIWPEKVVNAVLLTTRVLAAVVPTLIGPAQVIALLPTMAMGLVWPMTPLNTTGFSITRAAPEAKKPTIVLSELLTVTPPTPSGPEVTTPPEEVEFNPNPRKPRFSNVPPEYVLSPPRSVEPPSATVEEVRRTPPLPEMTPLKVWDVPLELASVNCAKLV